MDPQFRFSWWIKQHTDRRAYMIYWSGCDGFMIAQYLKTTQDKLFFILWKTLNLFINDFDDIVVGLPQELFPANRNHGTLRTHSPKNVVWCTRCNIIAAQCAYTAYTLLNRRGWWPLACMSYLWTMRPVYAPCVLPSLPDTPAAANDDLRQYVTVLNCSQDNGKNDARSLLLWSRRDSGSNHWERYTFYLKSIIVIHNLNWKTAHWFKKYFALFLHRRVISTPQPCNLSTPKPMKQANQMQLQQQGEPSPTF